jgi:hypothetical protein
MVRGDTLELTLRVLDDGDSPMPLKTFEQEVDGPMRDFSKAASHRFSMVATAELKDGGDLPVFSLSSRQRCEVLYAGEDQLILIIGEALTNNLPAPLKLTLAMRVTRHVEDGPRYVSSIWSGNLLLEKSFCGNES